MQRTKRAKQKRKLPFDCKGYMYIGKQNKIDKRRLCVECADGWRGGMWQVGSLGCVAWCGRRRHCQQRTRGGTTKETLGNATKRPTKSTQFMPQVQYSTINVCVCLCAQPALHVCTTDFGHLPITLLLWRRRTRRVGVWRRWALDRT